MVSFVQYVKTMQIIKPRDRVHLGFAQGSFYHEGWWPRESGHYPLPGAYGEHGEKLAAWRRLRNGMAREQERVGGQMDRNMDWERWVDGQLGARVKLFPWISFQIMFIENNVQQRHIEETKDPRKKCLLWADK